MEGLCQIRNKNKAVDKHHDDYSKPLELILVCRQCHKNINHSSQSDSSVALEQTEHTPEEARSSSGAHSQQKLLGKDSGTPLLRETRSAGTFNLSEKRKELYVYLIEQFGKGSLIPQDVMRVVEQQDKEFIQRLKDKADVKIAEHTIDMNEDLLTIKRGDLNKLAGDDLVK